MQLTVATGTLEVAAQVPGHVHAPNFPTYALHTHPAPAGAPAAGTLYYKRSSSDSQVDVIQLGTGAHTTLGHWGFRWPTYLCACTVDGKVVISTNGGANAQLELWHPADTAHAALQLLAGGAQMGRQPHDALEGRQAAFACITAVAIGPGGELWVYDDWSSHMRSGADSDSSRAVRVGASLVPPLYFSGAQSHGRQWEVAGSAADLMAAQAPLFASGEGADVLIRVGHGVVLRAHSFVLVAHSAAAATGIRQRAAATPHAAGTAAACCAGLRRAPAACSLPGGSTRTHRCAQRAAVAGVCG